MAGRAVVPLVTAKEEENGRREREIIRNKG